MLHVQLWLPLSRAVAYLKLINVFPCVQSILLATQHSFAAMKRRLGSKTATGIFYMERPFFDVDVELKVKPIVHLSSTTTACVRPKDMVAVVQR
jgi:hypothetical protein